MGDQGETVTKDFPLGDVLSVTTEHLVSRSRMDGLYTILNFMTGDNLFTHALPRANDECKPALFAQHPALAEVVVPEWGDDVTAEDVFGWLAEQEAIYGETLPVAPLGADEHTVIDPISELRMMRPDVPIIAVEARPDGT